MKIESFLELEGQVFQSSFRTRLLSKGEEKDVAINGTSRPPTIGRERGGGDGVCRKVGDQGQEEVVTEIAPEVTSKTKLATPRPGMKKIRGRFLEGTTFFCWQRVSGH
ncbi:hypothetical protein L6452_22474 [Arctium lappa]|uniref:Uncharacterized protein n=1 Tax=Arctium lappa TaxID=4217 RepID=A0ACB9AZX5_ARCLA|nr:hypothetical protein L6452_22474 [Arctium lappa]